LPKERGSTDQEVRPLTGDEMPTELAFSNLGAPLLRHIVAALAIRHGRAPLPVSRTLWKRLMDRGVPSCVEELFEVARRYMFLGDARMLIAELNAKPRPKQAERTLAPRSFAPKLEEHPEFRVRRLADDK
jgi:DNA-binding NtrC family response regulator